MATFADQFTKPSTPLTDMTVVELASLKRQWSATAKAHAMARMTYIVARRFGVLVDARYTKHEARLPSGLVVWYDSYAGFGRIRLNGKTVLYTTNRDNDQWDVIPGEWMDELAQHAKDAAIEEAAEKADRGAKERADLIASMTL